MKWQALCLWHHKLLLYVTGYLLNELLLGSAASTTRQHVSITTVDMIQASDLSPVVGKYRPFKFNSDPMETRSFLSTIFLAKIRIPGFRQSFRSSFGDLTDLVLLSCLLGDPEYKKSGALNIPLFCRRHEIYSRLWLWLLTSRN